MINSFEDGKHMGKEIADMQRELLPSVTSSLINIDYQLEARIVHDSTFGSGQEIPPLFFPLIIARDPEGPFDQGNDGMVAQQMQQ
jgi:hypothetical protein